LPSVNEFVAPAYYAEPKELVQFSSKAPLTGGKVSLLLNTNVAIPPPLSRNRFWQEVNKRAGAKLDFDMVVGADYLTKFQTTIAGDDLPDLVGIRVVEGLPELLKQKFVNLAPYLAGDKIKEYPGLANIPPLTWRGSVFGDGLYTIPIPRATPDHEMAVRADIVKARGGNLDVRSYQDFLDLCKAVNDPKHESWAMGSPSSTMLFVREMLGNANGWAVDANGHFTSAYEQDTFKQAIAAVAAQWKAGLYEPDSFSESVKVADWIGTGRIVMDDDISSGGYYGAYRDTGISPDLEMAMVVPPKYDGGGDGHKYFGTGDYGYGPGTALRQTSESRIEELLEFANWLAAPFGTEESIFFGYGIEGVDFTYKNGIPVRTSTGVAETALPVTYIAAPPWVNYIAGQPGFVKQYYDWEVRCSKIAMTDPTVGLYSATALGPGVALANALSDTTDSIVQGRKSLSQWDSAVKTWQTGGGNAIRGEYEKAYAAANG